MAQYQGNGNQKLTLGEQTTADGLVYRGVAADTTRKPSVDTMAYILLDTNTNIIWQYKKATNNAWTRVGGSISSGVTGVLPVANGGTNTSTAFAAGSVVFAGASGTYTQDNGGLFYDNTNDRLGIGTTSPGVKLDVVGTTRMQNTSTGFAEMLISIPGAGRQPNFFARVYGQDFVSPTTILGLNPAGNVFFRTSTNTLPGPKLAIGTATDSEVIIGSNNLERMRITGGGEVWIGYTTDQGAYRLQVLDSVYVGGSVSASAYTTRSDYDLKDEIQNINYGLNEVMQMQPVKYTYKSNGSTQLGFIAQDLGVITPEVVSFEDKMSVYYNALIPILTKAIQEQQALIKALEQRIINLENK